MSTQTLTRALHQLRGRLRLREVAGLSDGELLQRFLDLHEEAAFEALLRRHGPMVLGVCRRVLRNDADAEDAFQATFLVLVRKAASIVPRGRVGAWLYGVAYRTALKARTLAVRRRWRESVARPGRPCHGRDDSDRLDLLPLLDRELNGLPEKYRAAIILCDLQGQDREAAAGQLGVPEGTLSSRLARSRGLLRRRLLRRGVAGCLAAGAALLSSLAQAAVPPALLSSTTTAALGGAAGTAAAGGLISAPVAALTQGVLQAMLLTRFNLTAGVLLVGALAGLGTGLFVPRALAEKPGAARPAEDKPVKDKTPTGPTLTGVVGAYSGKGTITLQVHTNPAKKEVTDKTLALTGDTKILLEHGLLKETKPGQVSDLTPGTPVSATLSVDGKAVVSLHVRGGSLHGSVKAVDVGKRTITLTMKTKGGLEEKTVELMKDAKVIADDGIGKKGDTPKEAKLDDLHEGTQVVVHLSGYDRKQATGVQASGTTYGGSLKGVDVGNRSITIIVKEDGNLVEKSFFVAKAAHVDGGKLEDLAADTYVAVRVSFLDPKTVVQIHVPKK